MLLASKTLTVPGKCNSFYSVRLFWVGNGYKAPFSNWVYVKRQAKCNIIPLYPRFHLYPCNVAILFLQRDEGNNKATAEVKRMQERLIPTRF